MEVEMIKREIEDRWTPKASNVNGRRNDVPKPEHITIGSPQDDRRINLKAGDAVFIYDGGQPTIEPKSVGWIEERTESHVAIDCYSAHSIERVEGYRNDSNEAETYGGMKGEIKRILDVLRKGHKEFLYIVPDAWNYMHENEPGGIWRGQWEITLVKYSTIDC